MNGVESTHLIKLNYSNTLTAFMQPAATLKKIRVKITPKKKITHLFQCCRTLIHYGTFTRNLWGKQINKTKQRFDRR